MDVERDWIFDDWIVKISPAMFNMDGAVRIIAEDLGASESDFDYNDVVFDAKVANVWDGTQNSNRLVAWITVRAAGGTLPLFVAGKEVHELFGVDTKVMVNTNNGTISKSPVSFKADLGPANWNISGTEAVKSIPINVLVKEGGVITLNSNVGEPSEKLCVSTAYQWCDERVPIQEEYPDFKRYVTDKNIQWYQVQ
jgi:hypothetical protein